MSHTATSEPLEVIVIGAGQAGLAAAYHLKQRGVRFLVVDAAPELGHAWRSRWDSLRLFTAAQYDALPGMPFPAPADTYPTKDEAADYLVAYAHRFALPVLLNCAVERLTRLRGGFAVETSQGRLLARQVVVATGPLQKPVVPAVAHDLGEAVVQLHSSGYRNPADLPSGESWWSAPATPAARSLSSSPQPTGSRSRWAPSRSSCRSGSSAATCSGG